MIQLTLKKINNTMNETKGWDDFFNTKKINEEFEEEEEEYTVNIKEIKFNVNDIKIFKKNKNYILTVKTTDGTLTTKLTNENDDSDDDRPDF